MKKGAKLSAHSFTNPNDVLTESLDYKGHPAQLEK